ncbi:hypothetical protein [Vannielia sp.]|uniref:hypothetical protein n=1 Tax=Vannielia sp. TaxID=2813045 RepID=UPI0026133A13|nr:hypothetical protein [Vannielia sp.]MDF1871552.1 hypothetical protein [Vannielia sp.]
MPVTYQILADLGIVYVRYDGPMDVAESGALFASYMADPGFRPGQKQLVDLSRITGYERDFAGLLALQAKKAEAFLQGPETIIVYYAPGGVAREVAHLAMRSWENLDAIVALVQDTEAGTLSVLGLSETSFSALIQGAV